MAKNRNNFYTRIFKKLNDEISNSENEVDANDDLVNPIFLGHLKAIEHYMRVKDRENGFFACQVIIENWFEKERATF